MRICVIGAGAIGGVIAARIAASGGDAEVSVLARGATLAAVRERGLRVSATASGSSGGTVTARVAASDDAAELGPQDYVIVSVKAQSMAGVAASAAPLLGESTAVLSTLNG